MKITVTENVTREIELHSKYFKKLSWYYMILDENTMMVVKDFEQNEANSALWLFPEIRIDRLLASFISESEPISEAEFKAAFLRVSVRIEETLSN